MCNTRSRSDESRKGKKVIAGYFDPAVSKQLKQLALEHDTTVQALLARLLIYYLSRTVGHQLREVIGTN